MNKVIFDNQCSLCISIKNKLERIDKRNKFLWISSNDYMQSGNIHLRINEELIKSTIIVINNNGLIMTEFIACRYILSRIPLFYPIIFLLYIPFISVFIGNKLYRLIARNRGCSI